MYNIIIGINVTWDEEKNRSNQKKHGVSFEEAQMVFYDDDSVLFDDPDHSFGEERFLIIGITSTEKLCIVSHCYRDDNKVLRIISARKATRHEQNIYWNNLVGRL